MRLSKNSSGAYYFSRTLVDIFYCLVCFTLAVEDRFQRVF
jgi:hypothetical protein